MMGADRQNEPFRQRPLFVRLSAPNGLPARTVAAECALCALEDTRVSLDGPDGMGSRAVLHVGDIHFGKLTVPRVSILPPLVQQ